MIRRPLVLLALLVAACAPPPDFRQADGTAGHYAQWQGRWVVINYWAEWCAPCRHEIPELNALHKIRDQESVAVVGVNFDGLEGEPLNDLIGRMGIEFPVIVGAPRLRWEYPMPSVLPTTVIIDPEGQVAATLVGPQTLESLRAVWSAPERPAGS